MPTAGDVVKGPLPTVASFPRQELATLGIVRVAMRDWENDGIYNCV